MVGDSDSKEARFPRFYSLICTNKHESKPKSITITEKQVGGWQLHINTLVLV